MKVLCLFVALFCGIYGAPKLRIYPEQARPQLLTLPSNATSIRTDISDSFSCEGRDYGYYADVENDCQLFHVCLPVTYSDGRAQTFRWSFICPEDTVFNQEIFTCTNADESIDCAQSPKYYDLNLRFGKIEEEEQNAVVSEHPHHSPLGEIEDEAVVPAEVPQHLARRAKRIKKLE